MNNPTAEAIAWRKLYVAERANFYRNNDHDGAMAKTLAENDAREFDKDFATLIDASRAEQAGGDCPDCTRSVESPCPKCGRDNETRLDGDYRLPCDVVVAPATKIRKGCKLATLIECISLRDKENPFPDADMALAKSLFGQPKPEDGEAQQPKPGQIRRVNADATDYEWVDPQRPDGEAVEWQFHMKEWPADAWNRIPREEYEDLKAGRNWHGPVDVFELRALYAAAPAPSAVGEGNWSHLTNEWADTATSGLQWLRNIRDGISDVAVAVANMDEQVKRCMSLANTSPPSREVGDVRDIAGQAKSWEKVCELLNKIAPGWWNHDGTGYSCAEAAILRLSAAPRQDYTEQYYCTEFIYEDGSRDYQFKPSPSKPVVSETPLYRRSAKQAGSRGAVEHFRKYWIPQLKKYSDNGTHPRIPSGTSAGLLYELAVEIEWLIAALEQPAPGAVDESVGYVDERGSAIWYTEKGWNLQPCAGTELFAKPRIDTDLADKLGTHLAEIHDVHLSPGELLSALTAALTPDAIRPGG